MNWELVGSDKVHCRAHNETFDKGLTCAACDAEGPAPLPDPGLDAEDTAAAPEGCMSTLDHERRFTQLATLAHEIVQAAAKEQKPSYSTIAKLLDAEIKAGRAAVELAREREERKYVATLRKEKRERQARGN